MDNKYLYKSLCEKISGPSFRNPLKNYIDENCSSFINVEENSFEQGQLFKEMNQLLENLLQKVLFELQISQEEFIKLAEEGLKDPFYKKYFNQIINFGDYNFFKNIMTKRNYQIIKMAEQQMRIEQTIKKEDDELSKAIAISLEEENKNQRNNQIEDNYNKLTEIVNLNKILKGGEPSKKEELKQVEPDELNINQNNNHFLLNSNQIVNNTLISKDLKKNQKYINNDINNININKGQEIKIGNIEDLLIDNANDNNYININKKNSNDDIHIDKVLIPENFNGKIPDYTQERQNELRRFRNKVVKRKIKGRKNDNQKI